jgi:hypothetical protein
MGVDLMSDDGHERTRRAAWESMKQSDSDNLMDGASFDEFDIVEIPMSCVVCQAKGYLPYAYIKGRSPLCLISGTDIGDEGGLPCICPGCTDDMSIPELREKRDDYLADVLGMVKEGRERVGDGAGTLEITHTMGEDSPELTRVTPAKDVEEYFKGKEEVRKTEETAFKSSEDKRKEREYTAFMERQHIRKGRIH